jgi:hypothetical protein
MGSTPRRILLVITALLLPALASADMGLPFIALSYPAMAILLLPVIFIETAIYRRRLSLPYWKIWAAVAKGNAVSTLAGYPFAWILGPIIMNLLIIPAHYSPNSTFWVTAQKATNIAFWTGEGAGRLDFYAALIGLVPSFFISVYMEEVIIRRKLDEQRTAILPLSWLANLCSYVFLIIVFWAFCGS